MNDFLKPELDPEFLPAALWRKQFRQDAQVQAGPAVTIALGDDKDRFTHFSLQLLPENPDNKARNARYLERTLKFLLWQRGGNQILIAGAPQTTESLSRCYSQRGERAFDSDFIGRRVYGTPLQLHAISEAALPKASDPGLEMETRLNGNRIGFDLGGSDRKCAAIREGQVVFSEEVPWDPYFQSDPNYHLAGIEQSLKSAAAHLPRVDAIGGSAAGIYIDNEVRAASLFRGLTDEAFQNQIRYAFIEIGKRWGVPLRVVNDGEVTALAGSLWLNKTAVLGISMGTSTAAGYVARDGRITRYLNELAFVPIDYREDGPRDEWSGDQGCSVSYLSQQAVARLLPKAGLEIPNDWPAPKKLNAVQAALEKGEPAAFSIYRTLGVYLGYALAHYHEFLDFEQVLLLGRVTSGKGGDIIIENAKKVLERHFPELAKVIQLSLPSETEKRHGQAIAAAALPSF